MRRRVLCILLPFLLAQTRPAATNPTLWSQLQTINAKTLAVKTLTADFEQQKITPMLLQPLISHGKLIVLGSTMLWSTTDPEPTQMLIDSQHIEIYYPDQKTLEFYNVEQKLAALAASPLPRLSVLAKYFTFASETNQNPHNTLSLKLTPIGELGQHIQQVDVTLATDTGLLSQMTLVDTDQDHTTITFSNIRTDVPLRDTDVELKLPHDVKVTHPLAGLESEGP